MDGFGAAHFCGFWKINVKKAGPPCIQRVTAAKIG